MHLQCCNRVKAHIRRKAWRPWGDQQALRRYIANRMTAAIVIKAQLMHSNAQKWIHLNSNFLKRCTSTVSAAHIFRTNANQTDVPTHSNLRKNGGCFQSSISLEFSVRLGLDIQVFFITFQTLRVRWYKEHSILAFNFIIVDWECPSFLRGLLCVWPIQIVCNALMRILCSIMK